MYYATTDDLLKKIPEVNVIELIDDENTQPATIADANDAQKSRITDALSDASARIDLYLAKRYQLPLATVPSVLVSLCADMTVYNLYARRDHAEIPDSRQKLFDNAVKMLTQISTGSITLGIGGADATESERADFSDCQGNQQFFTNNSFGGF